MANALDRLIAKQFGYVTRAQLLGLGLGADAIDYRIAVGRLIPVYRGVYAEGHRPVTPLPRAFAAIIACGDHAVLSHGSAASLWGFRKDWDTPFEVTTPSLRKRRGVRVHRSRALARVDVTRQLGIRATSPARTVLDYAPRLTGKPLSRFVNDALRTHCLYGPALADVLNRNPTHPGNTRLLPFVQDPNDPTNSPLEDDFLILTARRQAA